jgi:hypothetical protein
VGEFGHRLHHRSEPGDGAGTQVVAVGEAAGNDDRVDALQVTVGVLEQDGFADTLRRPERVNLVTRSGETDDAEFHAATSSTIS